MRWLSRWFARRPCVDEPSALWFYVACDRCGEAIRVRADRRYDLASEMREPGESGPAYTMHKDIVGTRCFQRIAIEVGLDTRLQIVERHIRGGRWLTAEEYQAAYVPTTSQSEPSADHHGRREG
ncbi:MAG: hypothetical protein AB7N91_16940 [Candidatus Tectimicrobiota bacterium]